MYKKKNNHRYKIVLGVTMPGQGLYIPILVLGVAVFKAKVWTF